MAPRSPDLASCDFFLWGYLKGRAYTHKPRNLNELEGRHLARSAHDRSTAVGLSDGRFQAED
ncbi:hypothetical protein Cfor_06115 [Coptotermes formosanus]|uniref:Uncharacterized protein n=1 Tax=Coptotermes formosanus TaxID=36987 RepID=A0A6L2PYC0_COPFO|nr:hypothetical protein Cfor_06115 [Coptotermes formosanus]